jgi:peptide methionine sulfoxide reductase MsrA
LLYWRKKIITYIFCTNLVGYAGGTTSAPTYAKIGDHTGFIIYWLGNAYIFDLKSIYYPQKNEGVGQI